MTDDELRDKHADIVRVFGSILPGPLGDSAGFHLATARRLLELLPPADDGEPVTADWLLAVGFVSHQSGLGIVHLPLPSGGSLAWHQPAPWFGRPEHCWTLTDRDADGVYLPDLPTRGHVRRLCAALGIELKEGK